MDGVGTSIVGRPRRLSADRRARPAYTLIWEEPCFLDHPELFELMRSPNLRLLEHRGEMLILPNKWSSGRNRQVFLAALFLALQKRGLAPDYRTDEGASAPHFLYINEDSDIYVQQSKAVFTVSREVASCGGEVLFTSVSDNPLKETSDFIAAELA